MTDFIELPAEAGIEVPDGGVVSCVGDDGLHAPQRVGIMDDGVAFGPLAFALGPHPDHDPENDDDEDDEDDPTPVLALDSLRWIPEDTDGNAWLWGVGLAGAAGGTATQTEAGTTRRSVLIGAAAVLGLAAAGTARADDDDEDDEDEDLTIAEARVSRATAPYWVGVFDTIDAALPFGAEIRVLVDGARVESIEDGTYDHAGVGKTVGAGVTGDLEVRLADAAPFRDRIMAWARGVLYREEEITATYRLPEPAVEMDPGDEVSITTNRAVLAEAIELDGSRSVVELGGLGIPHASETWGRDRGFYDVRTRDGEPTLVFEAGAASPDSNRLTVRIRAGRIASTLDGVQRGIPTR